MLKNPNKAVGRELRRDATRAHKRPRRRLEKAIIAEPS